MAYKKGTKLLCIGLSPITRQRLDKIASLQSLRGPLEAIRFCIDFTVDSILPPESGREYSEDVVNAIHEIKRGLEELL